MRRIAAATMATRAMFSPIGLFGGALVPNLVPGLTLSIHIGRRRIDIPEDIIEPARPGPRREQLLLRAYQTGERMEEFRGGRVGNVPSAA